MIKGMHAMFYSSKADELRTFFKDKLQFSGHDIGEGWIIFQMPEADLGCHPADEENGVASGTPDISFYCDDIQQTVKELESRGVVFTSQIEDHGYGFVTYFEAPGNFSIMLYQPKYQK